MPGYVAVFKRTEKYQLSEVFQCARPTQLVKECLSWILCLFHRQLVQTLYRLPLPYHPKPCLNLIVHSIQVSQVWSTQRTVKSKLVFVFCQILETRSGNDSAHTVTNKVKNYSLFVHKATNEVLDLICKFFSHSFDVRLCVILVFL